MAKIKIKVTKLILAVLVLAVITYFSLPTVLYNLAKYYDNNPEGQVKAQILYQRIVQYFPHSHITPEALYWLALSINPPYLDEAGDRVLIFKDFTSSSFTQTGGAGIEVAINSYKTLQEKYPNSSFAEFVPLRLGELYFGLGQYKDAEQYLLQGLKNTKSKRKWISPDCNYKLIELYLREHRPEDALRMIKLYRTNNPESMHPDIFFLEGDVYRQLGDFKKAEALYKKVMDNLPVDSLEGEDIKANNDFWQEKVEQRLVQNKLEDLGQNKAKGTIRGLITRAGVPLEKVQVYLVDENISRNGFSTSEIKEYPTTFTDLWGNYEFSGISPGNYSIGLGIPKTYLNGYTVVSAQGQKIIEIAEGEVATKDFQVVPLIKTIKPQNGSTQPKDKIIFQWEPVKGADYYQLFMGSVVREDDGVSFSSSLIKDSITTSKIILTGSDLHQKMGIQYDDEGITPQSVLDSIYAGGEFNWTVKAFDKGGNLLTDSSGYQFHIDKSKLNTFFTTKEGLTPSDKLVLERKYDAAINAYEKDLKENPKDLHALSILSKLYRYHKEDWQKTQEYYEKLYKLTGLDYYLEEMAFNPYYQKQYQIAIPYFEKLVQSGKADWYEMYCLGRSYLELGNIGDSEKYFSQAVATKKCTRLDPLILKLAQGEWQKAYDVFNQLDQNRYIIKKILEDIVREKPTVPKGWQEYLLDIIKNGKDEQNNLEIDNSKLEELVKAIEKSV